MEYIMDYTYDTYDKRILPYFDALKEEFGSSYPLNRHTVLGVATAIIAGLGWVLLISSLMVAPFVSIVCENDDFVHFVHVLEILGYCVAAGIVGIILPFPLAHIGMQWLSAYKLEKHQHEHHALEQDLHAL